MQINDSIHRLTIPYKDIYTTVLFIKTEEGVVLFDAATFEDDVKEHILPAMAEFGIKKQEIKYLFISHNHGDHSGGLPWLIEALPHAIILSNSPSLAEKYADKSIQMMEDGEIVAGCLQYVSIPGHTPDAGGLLDLRTNTLMTGDALQVYGIYGSGKWGANIKWPALHIPALQKLHALETETLIMAHDYHPYGPIVEGKAEIDRCIDDCANALYKVRDAILADPDADDETLSANYNAVSGLPRVGRKVFAAVRTMMNH